MRKLFSRINNRKGFLGIELIFILFITASFYLIMSAPLKQSIKITEEGLVVIEEYADELLEKVEKEGYVTSKIKYEAEEFVEDLDYGYITIEGTDKKVEPGEEVHVKVEMYNQNLKGGKLNRVKALREGIAK